tara:strand:- start:144 stop:482 length:339 start_codon:yes stop_codon:yes gene_type:complete
VETETVYLFGALLTICGFLFGNLTSPSLRFAKKEIQYWRGQTGDFKKQLKAEKRGAGVSGIESMLDGDMSLGNILKMVKDNPEIIDQVKSAIGGLKQNKSIDDRSGLGQNFR